MLTLATSAEYSLVAKKGRATSSQAKMMERCSKQNSRLLRVGSVDGIHRNRGCQLGGVFRFADRLGVGTTNTAIAEQAMSEFVSD
jgi:hypothetical protein